MYNRLRIGNKNLILPFILLTNEKRIADASLRGFAVAVLAAVQLGPLQADVGRRFVRNRLNVNTATTTARGRDDNGFGTGRSYVIGL